MTAGGSGVLLKNVAAFGRVLRSSGLEVGPRRLEAAVRALEVQGVASREAVYWALSCALVSRREDMASFDVAFATFWDQRVSWERGEERASGDAEEVTSEERGGAGDPAPLVALPGPDEAGGEPAPAPADRGESWSPQERLRTLDFARYTERDFQEARRLVRRMRPDVPRRRSRRLRPAGAGRDLDRRGTLRAASRTEGHPVERAWREPRWVPRKLVFLIDVSGSMEPYARVLVLFAQAVAQAAGKVEVYTFGTRLTRITAELADRRSDRALRAAAAAISDWAGGTRIGESLRAFNRVARQRALTRGAVVVIFSDGCERGDAELLGEEMRRLHRAAHTVLWVNPLAGDPRFEPRTLGMVAALPSVDVLLAGHDLAALERLAAVMEAIPQRRSTSAPPGSTGRSVQR